MGSSRKRSICLSFPPSSVSCYLHVWFNIAQALIKRDISFFFQLTRAQYPAFANVTTSSLTLTRARTIHTFGTKLWLVKWVIRWRNDVYGSKKVLEYRTSSVQVNSLHCYLSDQLLFLPLYTWVHVYWNMTLHSLSENVWHRNCWRWHDY